MKILVTGGAGYIGSIPRMILNSSFMSLWIIYIWTSESKPFVLFKIFQLSRVMFEIHF